MRSRFALLCAVATAALAPPAAAADDAPCPAPITIYEAARIVTMEPALPTARFVAVREDRILGVGRTREDLRAWEARCPARLDRRFAKQVLLPGFIDPHLHPMLGAVLLPGAFAAPDTWELPTGRVEGVVTPEAYRARLATLVASWPANDFLVVWGYHPHWHGALDRAALDALAPDRPLLVWHRSFHEIFVNSLALARMGIDPGARSLGPLPPGIDPHHIDLARGHFFETGLVAALPRLAPVLQAPERIARGLALTARMVHDGGITTMADMATGIYGDLEAEVRAMRAAYEHDATPFRLLLVPTVKLLVAKAGSPAAALRLAEALPERFPGRRVFFGRHAKLIADGAFFSQLMQMGPPGYADGHSGEWVTPPEAMRASGRPFWDAGFDLHIHVTGDAGVAAALDLVQAFHDAHPRLDHRTSLEHYGYSTEDQNRRVARLGAVVSAQPWYVHVLGDAYAERGLGWDRASQMSRLGSLERKQVPVALHSDLTIAPARPLELAWAAATRRTLGGHVLGPAERLSLEAALRAITIDAAFVLRMEDEIGSIRAGKKADFTVLDRDPFEVGADGLRDVRVSGTVFEGRVFARQP